MITKGGEGVKEERPLPKGGICIDVNLDEFYHGSPTLHRGRITRGCDCGRVDFRAGRNKLLVILGADCQTVWGKDKGGATDDTSRRDLKLD